MVSASSQGGSVLKRLVVLVAVATSVLLAGCAGAGSGAPSASGGSVATGQPSAAPGASDSGGGASGSSSGDISAQFGGDVCSALTKAEIEAATYPQGAATFSSTDTQKDAATGKAVVCQYLVTTCVSALGRDGVVFMAAARAGKRAST